MPNGDDSVLASNLETAQSILREVQWALRPWGASDHWVDRIRSLGFVYPKLGLTRLKTMADYNLRQAILPAKWQEREWETRARYTLQEGVGNCGEQACLALWLLKNYRPNRPIELMSLTNEDHAFVVVGRAKDSQVSDPNTWGPAAVVCDPWMNQAYPASKFYDASHMQITWGVPDLEFRIEN